VHVRLGNLAAARDYYEQARVVRLDAGDPEGEAGSLQGLGYVLGDLGQLHQQITYLQQASELWRRLERPEAEGLAEHNTAWAYYMLDDYDRALAHFERALMLRRGAGDLAGEAQTLNQIGNVYRTLGAYERAIEFYHTSLAGRRLAGDRRGEAYTLQSLGHTHASGRTTSVRAKRAHRRLPSSARSPIETVCPAVWPISRRPPRRPGILDSPRRRPASPSAHGPARLPHMGAGPAQPNCRCASRCGEL
jgi:tetratricopeptide (TPR) repeat protein